jgi:hypothetical protein
MTNEREYTIIWKSVGYKPTVPMINGERSKPFDGASEDCLNHVLRELFVDKFHGEKIRLFF